MKPVLFCSFLVAFAIFSCKPKPLDNLKEVAKQAEENKVFRVSREKLASETQRVADSVLTLVLAEQKQFLQKEPDAVGACSFLGLTAYDQFRQKYNGRMALVSTEASRQSLETETAELRKYRNELSEPAGSYPAVFQTLNDSLLYVRPAKPEEMLCGKVDKESSLWVFRFPKQKLVEIMTIKVKPKPAKGPNW